jgi:hypothetical protein
MTATSSGADLRQMMMIAERYARTLAADAGSPPRVLMFERDGELDFAALDGQDRDAATQARRLLAQRGATSAVLLFESEDALGGDGHAVFCILGETNEGETAARRYRVHPLSRRRRLSVLSGDEGPESEDVFRPLFPVRPRSHRAGAAPDESTEAATAPTGQIVAA